MRSGWKIANLSLQPSAGSGGGSGNDFTYVGQGIVVGLFVDFFLEILVLAVCVPEHNTSTLRAGVGVESCCSKLFRSRVLAVDENPRVIDVVILCGSGMNVCWIESQFTCAVHRNSWAADQDLVLVGSANLTGHALHHNIEVGVLVRDPVQVKRLVGHFRSLMGPDGPSNAPDPRIPGDSSRMGASSPH